MPMRNLISPETHIHFMQLGNWALMGSAVMMLLSLVLLGYPGLNLGLDFTGGTVIEVGYPEAADLNVVREQLTGIGFDQAQVQYFGTASEVMIRIQPQEGLNSAEVSSQILRALGQGSDGIEMRRVEFVGPQVGDELIEDGGLAMLYALIGILIYITLRFEWRLALGTIAATVHDVLLTLGVFALLRVPFDLTVLAAILAVIGYSVNDSVVVLDRIRENFRRMRTGQPEEVIDAAINQTLSRTLMTSLTTLIAVIVLWLLGGPAIADFALALIVGIVVGTYSSVFVASVVALRLGLDRETLLPKELEELEDRP